MMNATYKKTFFELHSYTLMSLYDHWVRSIEDKESLVPNFYGILDQAKADLHALLALKLIKDVHDIVDVNKDMMSKYI